MIRYQINKDIFKLTYLPDYARYLLDNRLQELVTVGIRFMREADLPLLRPLSKFSEEELVALSIESNRQILEALAQNNISELIEQSAEKWIHNRLDIIDKNDIMAEDLTVGFFLRRKVFAYFLDAYTKNVVLQKFIISELDIYTTQEELIYYNIYLGIQQEQLIQSSKDLAFHKELLLEAQELGGMGSFLINFKDQSKSVFTPEYKKILEIEDVIFFDDFIRWIHPDDQDSVKAAIGPAYRSGGTYETNYRYNRSGRQKNIWSKGFILVEDGQRVLIRGVIRERD